MKPLQSSDHLWTSQPEFDTQCKIATVAPFVSMEEELLGYKDKLENMKVLVRHYQAQIETQKVRRDGVETVSRLLAEARQENLTLKRNQVTLETLIRNLQNRLQANGIPESKVIEDNEVFIPGMSRQTLNNLALENARLRSMLQKDANTVSIENLDSLQKAKEAQIDSDTEQGLRQTIERLEAENKSMKMKLTDLETLFKSSNNNKDQQLVEYQEEIKRLKQAINGSDNFQNIKIELPAFRQQLLAFANQFQVLESKLGQVEVISDHHSESVQNGKKPVGYSQLLEEKQKLQDRVEEVTKMNQHWQEFYTEHSKRTAALEIRVKDLEEKLREAQRSTSAAEIDRQVGLHLAMSREKMEQVEEQRKKAEDEADQLRHLLEVKNRDVLHLQHQVTILSQSGAGRSGEDQSTIDHLKAQIQVCTEDFEKERQDRQAALQKVVSLQEQVNRLRDEKEHLQTLLHTKMMPLGRVGPQEHPFGHYDGHDRANNLLPRGSVHPSQQHAHLAKQHYLSDLEYDLAGEIVVNNLGPVSMPATANELIARTPKAKSLPAEDNVESENFLTCPKCNKKFSEERQNELLAHLDECWD